MISWLVIQLIVYSILHVSAEECLSDKGIVEKLLTVEQDRTVPVSEDDNFIVDVSVKVDTMNIVAHTNNVEIDGQLIKRWKDPSLYFSHLVPCHSFLNMGKDRASFWQPHQMSSNGNENHELSERATMHVNQNGSVQLFQNALTYPFGNTTCTLILRNEATSRDSYLVRWDQSNQEQIVLKEIGDLILLGTDYDSAEVFQYNGVFDELSVSFHFRRGHKKILLLFFLPSTLFMMISWLSLTLGPMAITRSVLSVTSLLLLQLHYSNNLAGLPDTSGITAIDLWKIFSLLFVVLILMELVFVSCLASLGRSRLFWCCKRKDKKGKYFVEPLYEELNDLRARKSRRTSGCCRCTAMLMDFLSLCLFAVIFVGFAVFFYLHHSKMVQYIIDLDLNNFKVYL